MVNISAQRAASQPYDPHKRIQRWQVIKTVIICLPILHLCAVVIWMMCSFQHDDPISFFTLLGFFGLLGILFLSLCIGQYISYRRTQQRIACLRQQARKTTWKWLHTPHPASPPHDMSLPCTLACRWNRRYLFLMVSSVMLPSLIAIGYLVALPFSAKPLELFLVGTPWYVIATAILTGTIHPLLRSRLEFPHLSITEESITARYFNRQVTISWDKVSYFGLTGQKGSLIAFELADDHHIIYWETGLERPGWTGLLVPLRPLEEYNALLGLLPLWIMTRTRQPLLDMRYGKALRRDRNHPIILTDWPAQQLPVRALGTGKDSLKGLEHDGIPTNEHQG